jgi:L,D-peptidoglycan transpeptidase YkuD (ErfK/YbiS/YcfS/YnhG family)
MSTERFRPSRPRRTAGSRRHRRRAAVSVPVAVLACTGVLAAAALVAGCGAQRESGARPSRIADVAPLTSGQPAVGRAGRGAPQPDGSALPTAPVEPAQLPGVGPRTRAQIPAGAQQAVLVTGDGHDATTSTVRLFRRDARGGWAPAGPPWRAHNAAHGWTDRHHTGDLRSPIGVFTLTDAGGRLPSPGTKLSYDHAPIGFDVHGTGVEGEPLAGAFDYVIAIDYNRKPGMSPRDWTRPMGESRGGGIWLHVDHGGPTEGCVSLPKRVMVTLLRTLDPALHPVVVMGDAAALAR